VWWRGTVGVPIADVEGWAMLAQVRTGAFTAIDRRDGAHAGPESDDV
jgi:hypothetical protein